MPPSPTALSAPAPGPSFGAFLRLIRFSHTLFALPYAVAGFVLGWRHGGGVRPALLTLSGIMVAMVTARTAAMTFNRLVDRRFDATNPRTRARPSVTGAVSVRMMRAVVVASSSAFVLVSYWLNPLCGALSFVALAVILGYSLTKRFTPLAHFVLGVGLGLSPIGAYLAVRGAFDHDALGLGFVSVSVLFWTAGFDILYACEDLDHDRREALHSIPAALGIPGALLVARVSHALVPIFLFLAHRSLGLGPIFLTGIGIVTVLLVVQHRLVRAHDLSRVGAAFFQVNVAISVLVMCAALLEVWLGPGATR